MKTKSIKVILGTLGMNTEIFNEIPESFPLCLTL